MTHSHVVLVACAASKGADRGRARDVYVSPLFAAARQYAEQRSDKWYILSARYGVLDPDQVIERYDLPLNRMPIALRREWAANVNIRLLQVLPINARITILAGKRYREFVESVLRQHAFEVRVPLAGLGIGSQIQWLQRANAAQPISLER